MRIAKAISMKGRKTLPSFFRFVAYFYGVIVNKPRYPKGHGYAVRDPIYHRMSKEQ